MNRFSVCIRILLYIFFITTLVFPRGLQTQKSVTELIETLPKYEQELFENNPEIVGLAIGEIGQGGTTRKLGYKVFADTENAGNTYMNIEGYEFEIIPLRGGFKALEDLSGSENRRQHPYPIPMGVSTSNFLSCNFGLVSSGTLGFKVCDNVDSNLVGYITNNHVAASGGPNQCPNQAPIGTVEYHRSSGDAQCNQTLPTGTLLRFSPLNLGYPEPPTESRVDAAFVQSNDSNLSSSILEIGVPTATPRSPAIGELVRKSGRTTGLTMGRVSGIMGTITVNYDRTGQTVCGRARFRNVIIIEPVTPSDRFVAPGDSGSPVVDLNNNPVGLMVAEARDEQSGRTYGLANSISDVLTQLNVSFRCGSSEWSPWESLEGFLTSDPTAVAWGPNNLSVLARGLDSAVWYKAFDGVNWSDWQSLEGNILSAPSAAPWGANGIGVFVRGLDDGVWFNLFNAGGWSGWQSLGGRIISGPSAVSWGANGLAVFAQGIDSGVWFKTFDGVNWSLWQSLGGVITAPASAVQWGANGLAVLVRGLDNGVWSTIFDGRSWSGWRSLEGHVISGPSAGPWGANGLSVFVQGLDNGIWFKTFDGGSWSEWQSLGGVLRSEPSPVRWGADGLSLFVRGTDNGVWYKTFDGRSWSSWNGLGGSLSSMPIATSRGSTLDLFVQNSNRTLSHRRFRRGN